MIVWGGGSTLPLGSANYCYQGKILHKCTNRLFFENHKLAVFDITLYLESASWNTCWGPHFHLLSHTAVLHLASSLSPVMGAFEIKVFKSWFTILFVICNSILHPIDAFCWFWFWWQITTWWISQLVFCSEYPKSFQEECYFENCRESESIVAARWRSSVFGCHYWPLLADVCITITYKRSNEHFSCSVFHCVTNAHWLTLINEPCCYCRYLTDSSWRQHKTESLTVGST